MSKFYEWLSGNVGTRNKTKSYDGTIKSIITNGKEDLKLIHKADKSNERVTTVHTLQPREIKKTTGAGDTFTGTFCSMLLKGKSEREAVEYGLIGSKLTVEA